MSKEKNGVIPVNTFGKRIELKRKELHLTQKELADKLAVSDRTVSKWETDGGLPDHAFIPNLAEVLGVTIDYLYTGKTEERTINNDDMDMVKRAVILVENDDVNNFKKYDFDCHYVSPTVLLHKDKKYNKLKYASSTDKEKAELDKRIELEEEIKNAIYKHKSKKIFKLLLDKFLEEYKKECEQTDFAYLLEKDLDSFIIMCGLTKRFDGLDAIGAKWFAIGELNYLYHTFRNTSLAAPKSGAINAENTFHIKRETWETLFSKDVADDLIDYFCNGELYQNVKLKRGYDKLSRINFLFSELISILYETRRFDKLEKVLEKLSKSFDERQTDIEYDHPYHRNNNGDWLSTGFNNFVYGYFPKINTEEAEKNCDEEWLRRFSKYNKMLSEAFSDGRGGYLTEEDIQAIKVKHNPKSTEEEKIIADYTRHGLLDYRFLDELLKKGDKSVDGLIKLLKKTEKLYHKIIQISFIHYLELIETYVADKEYGKIYNFALDNNFTQLAEAALNIDDKKIIKESKTLFTNKEYVRFCEDESHDHMTFNSYNFRSWKYSAGEKYAELLDRQQAIFPIELRFESDDEGLSFAYGDLTDKNSRKVWYGEVDSYREYCARLKENYYSDFVVRINKMIAEKSK